MKTLLVIFLLFPALIFSQWIVRPSGHTDIIYGVSFSDMNTGMACGEAGRILKTVNGGMTWSQVNQNNTYWLGGIHMINNTTASAVGYPQKILRTTNTGGTWQQQGGTNFIPYYSVSFKDANTGLISGYVGTLLRTTNGGQTWGQVAGAPQVRLNTVKIIGVDKAILMG
ncbi:MAG TPA: YCF48-related protein, partial [Ignavibacteria bacterium]|nr:YCF48-related protein [Ignavibacteria bacterium]